MAPTRPPPDLRPAGRKLWRSISDPVKAWKLNPAEKAILADACRVQDRLADLHAELRRLPSWTTTGSMGQLVEHPVLVSLVRHESLFVRLIVSLKLPDLVSGETSTSARARKAAQVRWSRPRSS